MKILLCGADGRMGRVLSEMAPRQGDEIVCGLSLTEDLSGPYPIYGSFGRVREEAEIVLDFSSPALLAPLLRHTLSRGLPVVIGCTGHDEAALASITEAAQHIPVLRASNLSLGIAVLRRLMKLAQSALPGFDIEIEEKHHRMKKDAPSGTALAMFEDLKGQNPALRLQPGRFGLTGERDKNEVGLHALRGGTLVGEHTVSFFGEDEVLEIRHAAHSRRIFAAGALTAGHALIGKPAGLYTLDELLFGEDAR